MKSLKNIKYLFVARGPGEAGQARALAKFISQKGGKILFALQQAINLPFFLNDKEFEIFLTETPEKLKKIVEKEKPDVLLIFNSKMWGRRPEFSETIPFKHIPLVFCVDSNWLFNEERYPYNYIKWADKYLVLFPQKVFELGLNKNGGHFTVSEELSKKIIPVGFIPAYVKPEQREIIKIRQKYNISRGEKFIFSYFSGTGAGHRIFAFNNLVSAVDTLVRKGEKIKVLYVGPIEDLRPGKLKRSWLIVKKELSGDEYFLTLASSDLVFQHQGMVTLSQAISAEIPAICNIRFSKEERLPRIHLWEVGPFERVKACKMFFKSASITEIAGTIKELLYNPESIKKMRNAQKAIFENGEQRTFDIIEKELDRKLR